MKKMVLTVIGGGSVNWMNLIMRDVYLLESVSGGEIRLVDPRRHHAEAVAGMLRRFNEMRGRDFAISVAESRKEALRGADFVLCTFSPGSMAAFYNDLEIPIRYGIRQPVSMTVGPCGLSAALRTCPVAHTIATEMEEVCPDAVLLNVTNPMTAVTRALNLGARKIRPVGLCHEFHALGTYVGEFLGLPRPEGMPVLEYLYHYLPGQGFDYTVAGINHFIWLTKATLNGRDMLPVIREKSREKLCAPGAPGKEDIDKARSQFAKYALCDIFGCMPLAGDRHLIEFLPSLCNQRTGWGMEYGVKKTTISDRLRLQDRSLQKIYDIAEGKVEVDWQASAEETTILMDGLLSGKKASGIMNLPNAGQIENLPKGSIVETFADVTEEGKFVPRASGELPRAIAAMCRQQLEISELIVEAGLKGDREAFVQALALDPLSADASLREINALADELLFANRAWLDRFFDDGNPDFSDDSDAFSPRGNSG